MAILNNMSRTWSLHAHERQTFKAHALLAWMAFAVSLLFLSNCGLCVPVPVSRNVVRVPRATGAHQKAPKLDAVKEGVTTRRELEQIVTPFITEASAESFRSVRLWQMKVRSYLDADAVRPK